MLKRRIRLLALSPVIALASCPAPPDISPELTEYQRLVNNVGGIACDCFAELGYATPVECEDDMDELSNAQRECVADALVGNEEAGKEYLDCANTALTFYQQCLEANLDCDPDAHDACVGNYMASLASCPALPAEAQSAFNTCIQ